MEVLILGAIAAGLISTAAATSRNAATDEALAALNSDETVTVTQVGDHDWYVFTPTGPPPTTGYILYPGGWVDPRAYASLARTIAADGFLVVLDPAPFNLAVADINSASQIIEAFPDIESWAIGGHSLGGAMAAQFVAANPNMVDGLVLYAAYPAQRTDLSDFPIRVTSIYGNEDGVADMGEVLASADRLPQTQASSLFRVQIILNSVHTAPDYKMATTGVHFGPGTTATDGRRNRGFTLEAQQLVD
ncbi:MAG: alpha/beta hydrolase [Chloroflexota bacterium]